MSQPDGFDSIAMPGGTSWRAWTEQHWSALANGDAIALPEGMVHPRDAGFGVPWVRVGAGQVADWTRALPDGSRLHVHEYPEGLLVAHRDRWDPGRSPAHALLHVIAETPLGGLAARGVALVTAWRILR